MLPQVQELFIKVKKLHAEAYLAMKGFRENHPAKADMKELADTAYALREMSKLLDDTRKDADNAKEYLEKCACLIHTHLSQEQPIRTEYCTATPDVKMIPVTPQPKKDPEGYKNLLRYYGVHEDVVNSEFAILRPHWPSFVDWYTNQLEQGLPTPPGIDASKDRPEWRLKILAKKEVDA